jgi:FMN-dependent NADH-azoreductase
MNILQILSSARPSEGPQASASGTLADELGRQLETRHPGARRVVLDLAREPHPPLDPAALQALFTPPAQRSAEQAARVAQDDARIAELMAADAIVLAAPMYNFTVPVQLKAWIDAISRAGVTFSYSPQGPVGLVKGKTVYVVTTRGGVHRDKPSDQLVPYLRTVLGFLGMTEMHVIYAEGLAYGTEAAEQAMAQARVKLREYVDGTGAAALAVEE